MIYVKFVVGCMIFFVLWLCENFKIVNIREIKNKDKLMKNYYNEECILYFYF